MKAWEKKR